MVSSNDRPVPKGRSPFSRLISYTMRKRDRNRNQVHSMDYSLSRCVSKPLAGPVLEVTRGSLFDPQVLRDNNRLLMYCSERSTSSIVVYSSEDGKKWTWLSTALSPNHDCESWDCVVNRAFVCRTNERWLMWYTGQSSGTSRIGLAESDDGLHFKRLRREPVLEPTLPFEGVSVMNPCILAEGEGFRMWYSAGENYEPDVICHAASTDGITWSKHSQGPVFGPDASSPFDAYKVGACDVHRISGGYAMFYIGYQNLDVSRICLALSKDGIGEWTRSKDNPLVSPSSGSWDRHAIYKPSVLIDEVSDRMLIWYNGRNGTHEAIGFAEARPASAVLGGDK